MVKLFLAFVHVFIDFNRLSLCSFCTQKTGNYTTTIAADGSLFKRHPQFKNYMQETLAEILPEADITLMLSEDGSGKGAALIAAVASQMKKH